MLLGIKGRSELANSTETQFYGLKKVAIITLSRHFETAHFTRVLKEIVTKHFTENIATKTV